MKMLKSLVLLVMAGALSGCYLGVAVFEGGDVQSASGTRNCSGGNTCQFEITGTNFNESFTAIPREGYVFVKWASGSRFYCGESVNPTCIVNNTGLVGNETAEGVIASQLMIYVMPIFTFVGIDTDGDGTPDHLDEDDDNDGILDVDDLCPLDPNLNCGITFVRGYIDQDTTWTADDSPIRLVGIVSVAEGVTLTIQEGVEVFGADYEIRFSSGSLLIQGAAENPAVVKNLLLTGSETTEINETHLIGVRLVAQSLVLRNSVLEDTSVLPFSEDGSPSIIEFNTFLGVEYRSSITISGTRQGYTYVRNNLFSGTYFFLEATLGSGEKVIEFNSFLATDNLLATLDDDIANAANNYWGTTDTSQIEAMIFDRSDDSSLPGYINYLPILEAPHPDTPTEF